ncbi:hypothetical protein M758_3G031100 [Ceratodon purpureus]|uniref:Uncharacterized protein n=1 Tax=Ceratodon purpureus TaxID=3225 RepID=A0A8T0IHY7_CERPU|nr:hypothetical protein KC19_3G032300 [Ceratodon purpureus]KAG0621574.1 hypothetical protein M758_3G031100 [Ceratodon purpureus]
MLNIIQSQAKTSPAKSPLRDPTNTPRMSQPKLCQSTWTSSMKRTARLIRNRTPHPNSNFTAAMWRTNEAERNSTRLPKRPTNVTP